MSSIILCHVYEKLTISFQWLSGMIESVWNALLIMVSTRIFTNMLKSPNFDPKLFLPLGYPVRLAQLKQIIDFMKLNLDSIFYYEKQLFIHSLGYDVVQKMTDLIGALFLPRWYSPPTWIWWNSFGCVPV